MKKPFSDVFITSELDRRVPRKIDYLQEKRALQDLAARMVENPEEVLPRFVDLAMEMTGSISAGLSLFEETPAPGIFRWQYVRGTLLPFDGTTTPRNYSPCGVTLDQDRPVLSAHPERVYTWISDANITVPEVLLVPLYLGNKEPLGTLWIVSDKTGHFDSGHARAMTELASFVGKALRMVYRRDAKSRGTISKKTASKPKTATPFIAADFLAKIGDGRTVKKYRKNQEIFSQDDIADSVFFIRKGRVKVTIISEQGKEAVVAMLDKGDICGEACLSGQVQRITTARAMGDCEITRIEKKVLIRTLHDEPSLSAVFLEYMLKRTLRVEADLVDQLFNSSEKRLARALLMLANFGKEGRPEPVIAKISQETLAEMIGTTRSRVSFFMNKFRKMGFISYNGKMEIHSSLLSVVLNDMPPHIRADTGVPAED